MFFRHYLSWIALILFLFLYIFSPSGSSTTDAWYYAASIKYNDEIFHPHHLLYNAMGSLFCFLPAKAGFDILASLKVMNAIFAVLILLMVQRILYLMGFEEIIAVLISSLSGISFSVMRYATENETCIIPLFFALLASYKFLRYTITGDNKFVLSTAIWITIAVLFHQGYFFWWLGILAGLVSAKRRAPVLIYLLISLTGPAVYVVAIFLAKGNLQPVTVADFILGNLKGNAHFSLSGKVLFLSVVSLVRSFIQVHGYMLNIIKSNILLIIPAVISASAVIISLFRLPSLKRNIENHRFAFTILLVILMNFIFAVLSEGNVEFMVMIPVLVFIMVPVFTTSSKRFLSIVLAGLAVWNISYGLIPLHYKSHAPEQFLCDESIQKQDVNVIGYDAQLLKNMIYYQTGNEDSRNILRSPAAFKIRGNDITVLRKIIENALDAGTTIYTDCLGSFPISRATIIEGTFNAEFFSKYEFRIVKSWKSSLGERSVYEITGKLQQPL